MKKHCQTCEVLKMEVNAIKIIKQMTENDFYKRRENYINQIIKLEAILKEVGLSHLIPVREKTLSDHVKNDRCKIIPISSNFARI